MQLDLTLSVRSGPDFYTVLVFPSERGMVPDTSMAAWKRTAIVLWTTAAFILITGIIVGPIL